MSFSPAPSGPAGFAGIQEQRDRWEKKHRLAAAELLQTERRYCEQLELVTTVGIPCNFHPSVNLNPSQVRKKRASVLVTAALLSTVLCETFDGQGNPEERR